jgi:hypothetical protein
MEVMMEQLYADAPVPLESTLGEVGSRAVPELDRNSARWRLEGPSADWLVRGQPPPKSLTIHTSEQGVDCLSLLWSEFLIEPTGWTELPGLGTVYGAAAFLGSFRAGTRVRWYATHASGTARNVDEGAWENDTREVRWNGYTLFVVA